MVRSEAIYGRTGLQSSTNWISPSPSTSSMAMILSSLHDHALSGSDHHFPGGFLSPRAQFSECKVKVANLGCISSRSSAIIHGKTGSLLLLQLHPGARRQLAKLLRREVALGPRVELAEELACAPSKGQTPTHQTSGENRMEEVYHF